MKTNNIILGESIISNDVDKLKADNIYLAKELQSLSYRYNGLIKDSNKIITENNFFKRVVKRKAWRSAESTKRRKYK